MDGVSRFVIGRYIGGVIRRHPLLAVFTGLYCAGFLAWAISQGNREFLFYFVVMLAMIGLVMWADRRARFSGLLLWLLSIWGLLHMAGGNVRVAAEGIGFGTTARPGEATTVLYNLWLLPRQGIKYDQITHAYGFFAATTACWQALRRSLSTGGSWTMSVFVITACAGMGLGAVNEVVEYIATLRGPTNVGGYENNAQDLIFNGTGATCAAIGAWIGSKRSRGAGDGDRSSIIFGLLLTLVSAVVVGVLLARFATSGA